MLSICVVKKITIFIMILVACSSFSQNNIVDIEKVIFEGINTESYTSEIEDGEADIKYSIIYSPFLPAGGIYSITDNITGKEAIVQIGYAKVDRNPYLLYLPDYLFKFFTKSYEKEVEKIKLKVKFLAWNREGEESFYLNFQSLIVKPEDSFLAISKDGADKHYIQIGAFSYYQNSYPVIVDMIPYLKISPHFYLIKKEIIKDDKTIEMYRVLVGPYSVESAKKIVKEINSSKGTSVFIHSGKSIINEHASGDGK
ncbi:MAG: SPOR domain-containing protein [Spirochaetes bacterium]|nr:SPOR domain-containing protein [Spirochaetota bacterium]